MAVSHPLHDTPRHRQLDAALSQVNSVLLGKPRQVKLAFACLLAGGHLLIEDIPGVGKTTLAHALAATFDLDFQRIQFTSDLLPSDIIGISVYEREAGSFRFHPGPIFSQLLLAERGGKLMACCQLERRGDSGYFGMFAVDPLAQGAGLGKRVLAEAERIVGETWGCATLRMTVIVQRDELIAWYGRRGYRRTGQFEPFPYGDERFGIPRRDDLRFEVLLKNLTEAAA